MPDTARPGHDPTLRMLAAKRPFPVEPDLGSAPVIRAHGVTHVGRTREANEDHFVVADIDRVIRFQSSSFDLDAGASFPVGRQAKVLMVADGLGGHAHGDVASAVVIDAMLGAISTMQGPTDDEHRLAKALESFVQRAQVRLFEVAERKQLALRPGTTLTMAYVAWPTLFVVHVGDSRCYLLRDGELRRLTQDHTMAERLIDAGLDPEQAVLSRTRHILVNAIGGGAAELQVDLQRRRLQAGDRLLLCSDGLSDLVADNQIAKVVVESPGVMEAASDLVAAALAAGGTDNVTAVVMEAEAPAKQPIPNDDPPLQEDA